MKQKNQRFIAHLAFSWSIWDHYDPTRHSLCRDMYNHRDAEYTEEMHVKPFPLRSLRLCGSINLTFFLYKANAPATLDRGVIFNYVLLREHLQW